MDSILSQPSTDRCKGLLLNSLDSRIDISGSGTEIGAVETIADGDRLTVGASNVEAVSGHGSFSPRVTLTIGEEEPVDFDVPATVYLVDFVGLGDCGFGECFGEHESALTL